MQQFMVNLGWSFVSKIVFNEEDEKETLYVFHHKRKALIIGLSLMETTNTKFWTVLLITRSVLQLEDDPRIEGFSQANSWFRNDREACSVGYWQLFERQIVSTTTEADLANAVTEGVKDLELLAKFDSIDVSFFHDGREKQFVDQFDMMYFRHITRHVGGIDFKHYYPRSA